MRVDKYPLITQAPTNLPHDQPELLVIGDTFTPCSSTFPVTILASGLLRSYGAYAVWSVLCLIPHNTLHPFGVWVAVCRDDGWYLESGDYCADLPSALARYEVRFGNTLNPD